MLGWWYDFRNSGAKVGDVQQVRLPIELCAWGLHACPKAYDAWFYVRRPSPFPPLYRVRLDGQILNDHDKACAERRVILGKADGQKFMRNYLRNEALRHAEELDYPKVVRLYLKRGTHRKEALSIVRDAYPGHISKLHDAWTLIYEACNNHVPGESFKVLGPGWFNCEARDRFEKMALRVVRFVRCTR